MLAARPLALGGHLLGPFDGPLRPGDGPLRGGHGGHGVVALGDGAAHVFEEPGPLVGLVDDGVHTEGQAHGTVVVPLRGGGVHAENAGRRSLVQPDVRQLVEQGGIVRNRHRAVADCEQEPDASFPTLG